MLEYAGDKDSVNHIPNYAEEQLEHAKEQENKKRQTVSINYEEEYKKLKEENKNLVNIRDGLIKANKEINKQSAKNYDDYQEHLEMLRKEAVGENERLKKTLFEQEIENKKLKENLKNKEMRIEFLECAEEKTKEKLENYELLKRMAKVLLEGL